MHAFFDVGMDEDAITLGPKVCKRQVESVDAVCVATFAQLKFQRSDMKVRVFAWVEAMRGLESAVRFCEGNDGLDVGLDVFPEDERVVVAMPLGVSLFSSSLIEKAGFASDMALPNGRRGRWWSIFALKISHELANSIT